MANISILNNGNYLEQFASTLSSNDPYSNWSINSRIAATLQGFSDYNVAVGQDYRAGGFLNYGVLPDGRFRVTTDFFDLFYTGTFSTQGSLVSRIDVQGTDGSLTTVTGNIGYSGVPFFTNWTNNSSFSSLSYGTLVNGKFLLTSLDLMSTLSGGILSGKVIATRALITSDLLPSGTAYYEVSSGSGLPFTVTNAGQAQGQASVSSGSLSNVYIAVGDINTLTPIDQVSISGLQINTAAPSSAAFSNSAGDNYTVQGSYGVSLNVGAGNDFVQGGSANDTIAGEPGNDTIAGGLGIDTAIFTGTLSQYSFTKNLNSYIVSDKIAGRDGVDTLSNIEFLKFADKTISVSEATAVRVSETVLEGRYVSLYKASIGGNVLATPGLRAGDAMNDYIVLKGSAVKDYVLPKGLSAVVEYEDSSFGLIIKTGSGSKASFSEQKFSEYGMAQGKASKLTLAQVLSRETTADTDINGDGAIGELITQILDGNGDATQKDFGLYKTSSGAVALGSAGQSEGDTAGISVTLMASKSKGWVIPAGASVVGVAITDGGSLEVLTLRGKQQSAQKFDFDTGLIKGKAVALKTAQLDAREYYYGLDLTGDGEVSLVGQETVPIGWSV